MQYLMDPDDLYEILRAADLHEEDVKSNYSGRGMYGKTCLGLSLYGASKALDVGVALHKVLGEEAWEVIQTANMDSFGMGVILYFTGVQLDEDLPDVELLDEDDEDLDYDEDDL